jgi:hypothetical protein
LEKDGLMKKYIGILIIISLFYVTNVASDDQLSDDCPALFQAWVFNSIIEDTCEFGGMLGYRFGALVKLKCENELPESVRNDLGIVVARDVKLDYNKMGRVQFCKSVKPGYDDLVSAISEKPKTK